MKKYGKQLMNELPDDTTKLLTSLCTDWIPKGAEAVSGTCKKFVSSQCCLFSFTSLSFSLSLSLSLSLTLPLTPSHSLSPFPFVAPMPQYSNPGNYVKVFVNKKDHLTHFLEHMIKVHTMLAKCSPGLFDDSHIHTLPQVHAQLPDVVYNTLLELYLSDMGSCSQEEERRTKELKAMGLLQKPEVGPPVNTISLCSRDLRFFKVGYPLPYGSEVLLAQSMKLFAKIITPLLFFPVGCL